MVPAEEVEIKAITTWTVAPAGSGRPPGTEVDNIVAPKYLRANRPSGTGKIYFKTIPGISGQAEALKGIK